MYIDNTGAVTAGSTTNKYASASETGKSSALDKSAFLKLLCTEMQYQDPLSPMDNTEYISQMANFSALEQMQNLNKTVESLGDVLAYTLSNMNFQQAAGNVGKTVSYIDSSGLSKNGTIDSVSLSGGMLYYVIDGARVNAGSISAIGAQKQEDNELLDVLNDILDQLKDMQTVSA